jgi:hypothetical protein
MLKLAVEHMAFLLALKDRNYRPMAAVEYSVFLLMPHCHKCKEAVSEHLLQCRELPSYLKASFDCGALRNRDSHKSRRLKQNLQQEESLLLIYWLNKLVSSIYKTFRAESVKALLLPTFHIRGTNSRSTRISSFQPAISFSFHPQFHEALIRNVLASNQHTER